MQHAALPARRRRARHAFATFAALCLFGFTLYARTSLNTTVKGAAGPVDPTLQQQETRAPARPSRSRNLALQPEAQSFIRRAGRRFTEAGREVSVMVGTLSVGGEQKSVRIRRLQENGGERVEVSIDGGPTSLSWDTSRGPLSAGALADDSQKLLLERLVMDSPDQFALAQLRGASYYAVARGVRATDDNGADGYTGPLYDVVRVGEPAQEGDKGWASAWRLFYVNTATGFVEKIVSQEDGRTVEAALSDWERHAGEMLPSRITWTRGGQVFMELTFSSVTHGHKQ